MNNHKTLQVAQEEWNETHQKKKAKHKASEKQSGDFGSVISMRKYKLEAQVQLGEMSITHSQLEAPPLSDHTSALGANDRGAETDQN